MTNHENPNRTSPAASSVQAQGLHCADARGTDWLDAMAGRRGPFGHGFEPAAQAIRNVATSCLTGIIDAESKSESAAATLLRDRLQSSGLRCLEKIVVTESSDAAIERAVLGARRLGAPNRFRTIALVGSDHGRTALCRTLSGRPELHQNLGPMMAGFAHVAAGDIESLKRVVDDQAVAVVVSPMAIHAGAKLLDAGFLSQVRKICDDAGALLIADESRIPFGSCGAWLTTPAIADIEVDAVVLSSGLFGGLCGGILIGSSELTTLAEPRACEDPLLGAVLEATLLALGDHDWLASAMETHQQLAVELAERLSEFEFIQDIHANGANLGIELDGPAMELIESAAREHLRLESAGEHAVWMQLPIVISAMDREELLSRLVTAIQTTGRLATMASL